MIFGDKLIPLVLDGAKSVTRRPVKWEDTGFEIRKRPCKYEVGRTYGVQPVIKDGPGKGRGGKSVARIRILDVRREQLKDVGFVPTAEARREGFKDWGAFARYWEYLYGSYDPTQLVDRIEFELVEGTA